MEKLQFKHLLPLGLKNTEIFNPNEATYAGKQYYGLAA